MNRKIQKHIPAKPFIHHGENWYDRMLPYVDIDKPIKVYRNLHKACWSIKQERVIVHTRYITLKDVAYVVNERGRQRVLQEKKKNVHAWVRGFLCKPEDIEDNSYVDSVTYNPYKYESFVVEKNEFEVVPVFSSKYVEMCMIDDILKESGTGPVLAFGINE